MAAPVQVCASTACFGFVSEISHEQFFTAACIVLRAIMGEQLLGPVTVHVWVLTNKTTLLPYLCEVLFGVHAEMQGACSSQCSSQL